MKRKGVTMVEILIAILLLAVLAGIGIIGGSNQIARGHIDQTATSLEIFAANLEDAINDLGEVDLSGATTTSQQTAILTSYLDELAERYLGFDFDFATLELTSYGYTIQTNDYKDAWGTPCRMFATTGETHNRYTLASAGADAQWNDATYASAEYGDDILSISVMK